jgi:hypothetical protein
MNYLYDIVDIDGYEDIKQVIEKMNEKKVFIHSYNNGIRTLNDDLTINPVSNLILTILTSFSTLERNTTIERSKSGLLQSATVGKWSGGKYLPYGYKRDNKYLVIDENEEKIIKKIFELYLSGDGTLKICNYLNDNKIPTRFNSLNIKELNINGFVKQSSDFIWKDGTIYKILTNPLYKGERIFKGITVKSPIIIDPDQWERVNQLLKSKSNLIGNNTKYNYLFDRKLIKCGICGYNYYALKRSNNKDNRYTCISTRYKKNCGNVGIGIDKLNNAIWYFIRRSQSLIDQINQSIDNNSIKENILEIEKKLSEERKKIETFQSNEEKLIDLLLSDKITRELYDNRYNTLKSYWGESLSIEKELVIEKDKLIEFETKQNDLNNQLKNIKATPSLLKKMVNDIVKEITIYPVKGGYSLSNISNDKMVIIQLSLYTSTIPLYFIISHYSDLIQPLEKTDFDFQSYIVIGDSKELKKRITKIRHKIEM